MWITAKQLEERELHFSNLLKAHELDIEKRLSKLEKHVDSKLSEFEKEFTRITTRSAEDNKKINQLVSDMNVVKNAVRQVTGAAGLI